ncbi:MAG: DNA internalization-related competence protein ComEC/Rec2 [Arenimonas sp.]|uniref:DNA internalization-related competence protein ComEC/Rec2 n=1 Tax=Arenimonas sp. TaxID=1872635 RepID=UPI0025BADE71|nr:DNA internalization-related competence protein ComEC/Rec2 [Arenimonas sp.]MBW8368424.1 DNA internalization-related competence protein ComEC/Rec2 [Arenimonas sp.]
MPPARAVAPAPFGLAVAAALLLGVLAVQGLAHLPPWPAALVLGSAGVCLWLRCGAARLCGAALVGLALASLHGGAALAVQLPAERSGLQVSLEGRILGLPVGAADALRFELRVTAAQGEAATLVGRKLRLGWYTRPPDTLPVIEPGSVWRFEARLRTPRGLVNPGGFDFERRAVENAIAATGYVVEPDRARQLLPGSGLDHARSRLSQRIASALPPSQARFVIALALGDTRSLSDDDWQVLRATGLTHLIAISGFHVGLVAGFGALLGQLLHRVLPGQRRGWPRPQVTAASALVFASAYTALAGFALPTVRTLLMIAVVLLARLARRPQGLAEALAFALIAVLLADPLSVLAPGFWLSFLGVVWLAWCLPGVTEGKVLVPFVQAQGVAVLGLLPLSVWFFSQASLPGPLVNLVGIPWISLLVVPMALVGLALLPISDAAADACWQASGQLMQWLWIALERIAAWPPALVWLPEPSLVSVALAMAAAFWMLLPRGTPGKPLAALLMLPMLWPAIDRPAHGEFDLVLLDVGQGLSLLVRTRHHDLLYDAGAAVPRGLDLGEAVVLPALRAHGVRRLDALVLSHGDNDHAGGAGAVTRGMATARVLAPAGWATKGMTACQTGQAWTWDGVTFSFLHPTPHFPYLGNQSSCVLRVQANGASALLPGDIGRHVESRLAKLPTAEVRADVLLVPHHGSDTSSSLDFIAAVRPSLGLVAIGNQNRFGLPKAIVLDRYQRYRVALLDTASSGAIHLRLGPGGVQVRQRMRQDRRRYWRDAGPGASGYAIGSPEPDR